MSSLAENSINLENFLCFILFIKIDIPQFKNENFIALLFILSITRIQKSIYKLSLNRY